MLIHGGIKIVIRTNGDVVVDSVDNLIQMWQSCAVCVARTPRTNVARRSCFHPPKSSNYWCILLRFTPWIRSHYSTQWELARPSCFEVEYCQVLLDCICRCIIRLINIFEKYLDSRSCEILAYHTYSWEPKKGRRMKLELRREISRSGGKALLIILLINCEFFLLRTCSKILGLFCSFIV